MLSGEELARAVLKAKDRYALLSLGSAVPVVLTADGYLNPVSYTHLTLPTIYSV